MPIVITQLTSTNNLLRYLTPALIPLAIVMGMLVDGIGWERSMADQAVSVLARLEAPDRLVEAAKRFGLALKERKVHVRYQQPSR